MLKSLAAGLGGGYFAFCLKTSLKVRFWNNEPWTPESSRGSRFQVFLDHFSRRIQVKSNPGCEPTPLSFMVEARPR